MASLNLRGLLALGIFLCQSIFPVHTLPLKAEEIASQAKNASVSTADESTKGIEGVAYYYAKRYNGRRTNSGARYNPDKLTAAHPNLPHGTRIKVINLANNREVVVTVNDRCRKRRLPIIDLSRAAARKLGFYGKGSTKVVMVTLDEEPS